LLNILIHRYVLAILQRKNKTDCDEINRDLLAAMVLESTGPGADISLFEKFVASKRTRRLLVGEMIAYRNYFSGKIATRVCGLYLALGLDRIALQNLRARSWATRASALSELFRMDVPLDNSLLHVFLYDKNKYIREYARLFLIKQSPSDPLRFLAEENQPISHWEETEIFHLFEHDNQRKAPALNTLLSISNHPSLISLGLKLAAFFKEQEDIPAVLALVQIPDPRLRIEAIRTLGKMEARGAEETLVKQYEQETPEVQATILSTLGRIGSAGVVNFIERQFNESSSFEIKKHASDAIILLSKYSRAAIDRLLASTETLNRTILNHSLNPLINGL